MKKGFCYNALLIITLIFGCTESDILENLLNEKQSYTLRED